MFSEQQIEAIRTTTFPDIELERATISRSGENISTKLTFFVEENPENKKLFINDKIKKIKIRFFADKKQNIDELSNKNILEIEQYLSKHKIQHVTLAASNYKGSTGSLQDLIDPGMSNYRLRYQISLEIPAKTADDYSWFCYMYYDYQEFSRDTNISIENIDLRLLSGDIYYGSITEKTDYKYFDTVAINNFFNSLNNKTEIAIENSESLKIRYIPARNNQSFFSKLFHTTDVSNNTVLCFSIDIKKILQKNSSFQQIVKNTSETTDLSSFNSIKIIRRECEKTKETPIQYKLKNKTYESIISTSEGSDSVIQQNSNDISSIRQINCFEKLKTIEVIDKQIYKSNPSAYQYGVEISLLDKTYTALFGLREELIKNASFVKNYIQEIQVLKGYDIRTKKSLILQKYASDKQKIENTVADFISALYEIGLLNGEDSKNAAGLVLNIFDPLFTEDSSLEYFDAIHNRLINIFNKLLSMKSDNITKIEHWFKDIIDTSNNRSSGYEYFFKQKEGILRITNTALNNRITADMNSYSNSVLVNDNFIYSLSPVSVNILTNKTNFFDFVENNYIDKKPQITNNNFIDLEMDIKSYNSRDKSINPSLNLVSMGAPTLKRKNLLKGINGRGAYMETYAPSNNAANILNSGIEDAASSDPQINPEMLSLSILKNDIKPQRSNSHAITPFQIQSLLNKTDKFFSTSKTNFLNDLNINSKFLFLFNCICVVEYLNYSIDKVNNINNEKSWSILTKGNLNKFAVGANIFCRLRVYSNNIKNINSFNQISLPIYDSYFVLEKQNTDNQLESITRPTPIIKKTYSSKNDYGPSLNFSKNKSRIISQMSSTSNTNNTKQNRSKIIPKPFKNIPVRK